MTLDELLDYDSVKFKEFTDAQLLEFFTPALQVTRPELAPRPQRSGGSDSLVSPEIMNEFKLKLAKLKAAGIVVDEAALLKNLRDKHRKK